MLYIFIYIKFYNYIYFGSLWIDLLDGWISISLSSSLLIFTASIVPLFSGIVFLKSKFFKNINIIEIMEIASENTDKTIATIAKEFSIVLHKPSFSSFPLLQLVHLVEKMHSLQLSIF